MKASDKVRLVRNRGMIVRSLDVTTIMNFMVKENAITGSEEADILSDPRRRQRAARLLDIIEQKKTECYNTFLEALEDHYPHIYLTLIDWEEGDEDILVEDIEAGSPFTPARVDDEWHRIRKCRKYLIKEMDAKRIMPVLDGKEIFTGQEHDLIMKTRDPEKSTETFLDIIELKTGTAHEAFVEALGEIYPHIFLMLTDEQGEEEGDLFDEPTNLDLEEDMFDDMGGYGSPGEYLGANPGYYKRKNKSCVIS